ncbi:hypothetical protein LINPERHAP2_LOCUS17171, partial [Linum perenne]
KNFATLRTVIVTVAVHRGFSRRLPCHFTNFLDLPALGRRQPPYMILYTTLRRPVCLVNSHPDLVIATPLCEEAPLLPKLRDYFTKFLRESCLTPLGILYLPTCVDFEYMYPFVEGRSSFSWEYGMSYFSAGYSNIGSRHFLYPSYPTTI